MKFKTYEEALNYVFEHYKINSPDRSAAINDILNSAVSHLASVSGSSSTDIANINFFFECQLSSGKIFKNPFRVGHYYKSDSNNQCVAAAPIVCDPNAPAVNDHVCPTCKNTRCSKVEKICWRCGNNLHAA